MHASISSIVVQPMIKSYVTEAINNKSERITREPKVTAIPDIDPAQLPAVQSATMIRLSVSYSSNLKVLENLSHKTFGIIPKAKKPKTYSKYTPNLATC